VRLLTFDDGSGPHAGVQLGDQIVPAPSRTMTLVPGDVIATGTPAGVGASQGRFLRDGDTVEVEVEGLGTLANPVRAIRPLAESA
jgi:2-keto-4-pentenoate hydratase/2-oxohepta-3-ene-1,7-dioic acid hydratase in catechol pathway